MSLTFIVSSTPGRFSTPAGMTKLLSPTGMVIDAETQKPIYGANVKLFSRQGTYVDEIYSSLCSHEDTTGEGGYFEIDAVMPGNYNLVVRAYDYSIEITKIFVTHSSQIDGLVIELGDYGSLDISTFDKQTKIPVSARISVFAEDFSPIPLSMNLGFWHNLQGYFCRVWGLKPGRYTVSADSSWRGYATAVQEQVEVRADEATRIELELERTNSDVQIVYLDQNDSPVRQVHVTIRDQFGEKADETDIAWDGSFRCSLLPGTYTVNSLAKDFLPHEMPLEISQDKFEVIAECVHLVPIP